MHQYRNMLSFGIVLKNRLKKIVPKIRTHSVLDTVFYSDKNGFAFLSKFERYKSEARFHPKLFLE